MSPTQHNCQEMHFPFSKMETKKIVNIFFKVIYQMNFQPEQRISLGKKKNILSSFFFLSNFNISFIILFQK